MGRNIIQGITIGMITIGKATIEVEIVIMTGAMIEVGGMAAEGINLLKPANQRALYIYNVCALSVNSVNIIDW